ncbi:hypothetical protein [Variovorax sp. J31P207]|uniref:hypothetical protein n=1 Tax=Variovorax sp. J31P207 TaxID=3053510 RepID=UPI002575B578|nr:hypothetical protein [Variovorax sp. J31P207]MDM0071725.1 hypothetical protein [Variovorax sp. J31P207]
MKANRLRRLDCPHSRWGHAEIRSVLQDCSQDGFGRPNGWRSGLFIDLGAQGLVEHWHQTVHQPGLDRENECAVKGAGHDAPIQIVEDQSLGGKQGK